MANEQKSLTGVVSNRSARRTRRPKVAIVASHPIQHFCPFYAALAATGCVELKVFFGATVGALPYFDASFNQTISWQEDILNGYDYEYLAGAHRISSIQGSISNPTLTARLEAFAPDIVQVYGFFHGISRTAIRWAKWNRKRVFLVSDSELRHPRSALSRVRKWITVPFCLRQVNAFLTIGDCNEAYYTYYGSGPHHYFRCPIPVDERRLTDAIRHRMQLREEVRRRYNLPLDTTVAIFVGKLIERKRPDHAIRAIASLWQNGLAGRVHLLVVGDGPNREQYQAVAEELCPDAVRFAGFVRVTDLPACYVAADLLVHPAEADPHPLATSEGVFCGLPAVVSDRVGSVGPTDDIRLGINGWEYPFGNIGELAKLISMLVTNSELRIAASRASLGLGCERTLAQSVDGFLAAVRRVEDGSA